MILDEIVARTRLRVAAKKEIISPKEMRAKAEAMANDCEFPFEKALATGDLSFICEVKKASPSQGLIATDFPYVRIAREYEVAGAAAISCLTEPFYFQGKDEYLMEISRTVKIPVLRKDFIIDNYMIYEAKTLGAAAVLLICAILNQDLLENYIDITHRLGLSALVETHNEKEVQRALAAGARIIGVNNRDLTTFEVDHNTSVRLRPLVPADILFVSESGIKSADDIRVLRENRVDAALVGETLMRKKDKKAALAGLRGERLD